MPPGYRDRQPAGKTWPCTAAPAVRSSQAQVHVTNFDYNHHPLNTMPDPGLTSRARSAARGRVSSALRRAEHQAIARRRQPPGPPARRQSTGSHASAGMHPIGGPAECELGR